MHNAKYILPGLAIFLALAMMPFWYNIASGSSEGLPQIDPHSQAEQCVLSAAEMRESHMQLLNDWRNEVVREGKRIYTTADGRQFNMSLTKTCLECHESKAEFCDKCHDYAGVETDSKCFSCHVDPTTATGPAPLDEIHAQEAAR